MEPRGIPAWRWLWLLAWALLLARLAFVVGHQPLAGYANQFDMLRTTACFGLVPEGVAPGAASMSAPVADYLPIAASDANCLPGSEPAIVALALALDHAGDALGLGDAGHFPLRLLALVKSALLLLVVLVIDLRLRAWPRWRAGHLALAALLLGDPLNTLYLAGFYTEFAALLAAWAALAWPLPWLLRSTAPTPTALLGWGALLATLLLARFQHVATPFVALGWLVFLGWRARWPLARMLLPLVLLLPALATTLHWQAGYATIADANRWNSFFGAALPAASDPQEFVRALGLPAQCAELVHTTWYLRRGRDARAECAAGMDLARSRWLLQLAREPAALARWIGRGVTLSGQWRPGYLGELAGESLRRLPSGPLGIGASLADVVSQLPWTGLLLLWSLPLLAMLVLPPGLARAGGRDDEPIAALGDWVLPMLAGLLALGWAASLVGDGYSELARHLHLAGNAALLAAALFPCVLVHAWRTHSWQESAWMVPELAAAAALVYWLQWQATGYGVLDRPAGEAAQAPIDVSGWALDPRGVAGVDLIHADGRRDPLRIRDASAEFAAIFGAGVSRHAVRFEGRIEATRGGYVIEVRSPGGAPTRVDQRSR